ncbi:MAG TPA: exodeoxyribonuclease VII large subunit [Acidimicrobiales bacterium]|nr:exodeoxyribonuclease VII large subunit [Acidimicrobiales bacterium]
MTLFDAAPERSPVRRLSLVRLSAEIARSLTSIGKIAVEGEVHQPKARPNGRMYFTLKDRAAQVSVTVPAARTKRAWVVDGQRVQVTGVLSWDNSWGRMQLVADEVVPVGAGAVAAMIAEARSRLRADGLLDRPRRRLPRLPTSIGVVCGSEAAVRADIESVVAARFPGYPMVFREVTMTSSEAVMEGLRDLDLRSGVDVIILARGGGDATQLLPFSDEELCRAICATSTPVVAAIGHEGDRPLCDEVVDLRCGTPSLAAAAVVPDRDALLAELAASWTRAETAIVRRLDDAQHRLGAVDRDRAVTAGVERAADRLARSVGRLELVHPRRRLAPAATALASARREMDALSPVRVLERGYAVVRATDGAVLRSAADAATGQRVDVQLASGRLAATVEEVTP